MADEMRVSFLLRSHFYYTSQLVNELIKLPGVDAGILGYDDGCDTAAEDGLSTEQAMRRFLDDPDSLSLMHADNTSTSSILSNLGIVKYIAGWVRKQNPDILHLHDSCDYRFWLTRLLTRKVCPMVLTVHDATDHPGDVYGRRVIFREKLRRMADHIIVHGDVIKESLVKQGFSPDRISVIHHGCNTFHRKLVSREDWRSDTKDVVFFGRVVEYKGLDYLIQAQPLVSEAIPEARFVIAGSGPDWQRCRSFIKNSDSFEITDGFIPDSLVAKIVSHAAVVVMPYIEASQSGVVGIAYAFGKPVVATNVGALPKAVKDGETGLLVPPRDPRALADAIIKILTDNDLRQNMGQNALQVADDELSWKRSAEMTYQLYRRLTGSVA